MLSHWSLTCIPRRCWEHTHTVIEVLLLSIIGYLWCGILTATEVCWARQWSCIIIRTIISILCMYVHLFFNTLVNTKFTLNWDDKFFWNIIVQHFVDSIQHTFRILICYKLIVIIELVIKKRWLLPEKHHIC